jgi:hypothetical protein
LSEAVMTPPASVNVANSGVSTITSTGTVSTGAQTSTSGTQKPDTANQTAPKSVKITYDEGEPETELSLSDAAPEAEASGFKFESLDVLKDTHSDLHKALKAELSKASRFAKQFKTPEEARALVDRVGRLAEQLGDRGAGLDAIEAALQRQSAVLDAARNGDKGTVESWFKESPEGMAEFTTHALEQLSKADPKLADALSGKTFVQALVQKDIYGQSALDALNALYQHVADKPEARKLLDRVAATVNQHNTNAQYKPDTTARQTAALEKREAAVFAKQIDLAADEVVRPAASRALAALTAEMKGLSNEEKGEMRQFLVSEFYKQLAKDPAVKAKYAEMVKARDQNGIVALVKANRAKVMGEAAKALYKAKLLNRQAIKDEAASKSEAISGGVSAPRGKTTVHWTGKVHPEKGPQANMDFARMSAEGIEALDRLFYVKGDDRLWSW